MSEVALASDVRAVAFSTPVGRITAIGDDRGVTGCWFGDPAGLFGRLRLAEPPELVESIGEWSSALEAYLAGDVAAIDRIRVLQPGSGFRQDCWAAMRRVPAGQTISYAKLAEAAGHPSAVRAAGTACATNVIAVIVPCHRIVTSTGGLGGYAYGLAAKRWLLEHERGQATLA